MDVVAVGVRQLDLDHHRVDTAVRAEPAESVRAVAGRERLVPSTAECRGDRRAGVVGPLALRGLASLGGSRVLDLGLALASLGRRLPATADMNFDPSLNPGTITYSAENLIRIWVEIGEAVHRAGLR